MKSRIHHVREDLVQVLRALVALPHQNSCRSHGMKDAEPGDAIRSSHPVVALVFLTIAGAWAFGLIRNFDQTTQTARLPILGVTLQLGSAAANEGRHRNEPGAATNTQKDEDD